jgi:hypothetical protein
VVADNPVSVASGQPFSNGTEVDMFRDNRCSACPLADPEFGDCHDFGLSLVTGEWPSDLLVDVEVGPSNPLGVECVRRPETS